MIVIYIVCDFVKLQPDLEPTLNELEQTWTSRVRSWLCFPMSQEQGTRTTSPNFTLQEGIIGLYLREGERVGSRKVSGRCLEGVWKVSGRCLEGVWKVFGRCLEGVWKVSGRCKFFGTQIFSEIKFFQHPNFFRTQNFSGPKIFQTRPFFRTYILLEPKFFRAQIFSGH